MRIAAVLVFALALPLALRSADPVAPAGSWKLAVPLDQGEEVIFLLAFTEQDGKWVGDYIASSAELRVKPTFTALAVNGDAIKFTLGIMGRDLVSFDGLVSKDKKKIAGSMSVLGGRLQLTELHPSKLKALDDPFALARETLTQVESGPVLFEAAFDVLARAAAKKLPADEVRGIVERVNKAAAGYGPRWEREVALKLTGTLAGQEGLADVALAQARRAERLLTDADDAITRIQVLDALAQVLTKAGKADEAKTYTAQVAKLEARDYAEYAKTSPPFKPEPFAGRKAKSDRAVLVEVFTGAECPPCAAVDLAFDGLMKSYKLGEAVLLQYHCHIPAPDPLTSPDAEERMKYYGEQITGAPTTFIGGKLGQPGGGPAAASEKKYKAFRTQIDEGLEKPAGAKLALTLAKGEKGGLTAKANVTDLDTPGDKVMLRFALAEERVRYAGGNGIRYHHMVVRAMPGGAKGVPLTKKSQEQTVTIDPDELKAVLAKYMDDFTKAEGPFPRADRPLGLKNLKLVAFIQNDETKEVLTATQIDLDGK